MVMKFVLFLILLVCSGRVSAQYYELNKIQVVDILTGQEVLFELNLMDDIYCIEYSDIYSEGGTSFIFSYGRVSICGNKYYLMDMQSNMNIVLESNKDKSVFKIQKGFSIMQGHEFVYSGDKKDYEDMLNSFVRPYIKSKKSSDFCKLDNGFDQCTPLELGVYENNYISLYLGYDFQYSIKFSVYDFEQTISEGSWCKKRNKLELYDQFADHSFTALIDSCDIKVVDFPNELGSDCRFKKVKSKMLPFIFR